MSSSFIRWVRKTYHKVVHSIAFFPALISLGFFLLAVLMLELDFSETGKHIKSTLRWVRLRDTDTARNILATIIGGLISLTVFSFSMVMILLNQTASQMSNRTLEGMISNRFHQLILGFYIGSIVYALALLTTIRDIDSGVYVPALSIYLLLLITVANILLFIYFLHYVTQQAKYETTIRDIRHQTEQSIERCGTDEEMPSFPDGEAKPLLMPQADYFQGFDEKRLLRLLMEKKAQLRFLHPTGTYLLKGLPVAEIHCPEGISAEDEKVLMAMIDLFKGQHAERNHYYGFQQLTEVALRALSPGINDPQTAVLSLHALTDLFTQLLERKPAPVFRDTEGAVRILLPQRSAASILEDCFYPVWDYGKDDRHVQKAMQAMLSQLLSLPSARPVSPTLKSFLSVVEKAMANKELMVNMPSPD